MVILQWKLSVILFHIFLLPTSTTTLPFPDVPTTSVPAATKIPKTVSPLLSNLLPKQQPPIQPSSTKTTLGPSSLLPYQQNTSAQPIDCACSLPFNLFIECHVKKVEHCKSRPLNRASSDTTYSVNGTEISYDYIWPSFLLKHLQYDPSGHLTLSLGLMELLRNSILQHKLFSEPIPWAEVYRDLALPTEERSHQNQPIWDEDIQRDPIKETQLESKQVKDPILRNEPTGQISLALGGRPSWANYREQSEQVKDPVFQNEPSDQISLALGVGGKPSRVNDEEWPEGDIFGSHFSTNVGGDILEPWSAWPRNPHHDTGLVERHPGIGLVEPHPKRGRSRIKSKLRLL